MIHLPESIFTFLFFVEREGVKLSSKKKESASKKIKKKIF